MVDVGDEEVAELARAATGSEVPVAAWELVPSEHPPANLTTRGLARLRGTLEDGTAWSVFVKVLRPASDAPAWAEIPEVFHQQVLEDLDWQDEPRAYRCGLADALPDGLRMPTVLGIDETPSTVSLYLEDVADPGGWDAARDRRTARLLGRLAGRWSEDEAARAFSVRRRPMGRLFFGKVTHLDLALMADDRFWAAPAVAAVVDDDHRRDLDRLARAMPALLGQHDALPHGMAHGDAAPDNLLEPGDGTVVAIDWSYASVAPLGSDLGQVVAGRVGTCDRTPEEWRGLIATVCDGFVEGLADEGVTAEVGCVEQALVVDMATRFVFSALLVDPAEHPGADLAPLLRRRAVLARVGMDLALAAVPAA